MRLRVRMFRGFVLAVATIALMACAGRQPKEAVAAAPVVKPADHQGYRFYMTQNGKRMTADDFDAWLKANGLRVQGGRVVRNGGAARAASTTGTRPAATGRTNATAKAEAKAKASGTSKVVQTGKSKAKRKKAAVVTAVATR